MGSLCKKTNRFAITRQIGGRRTWGYHLLRWLTVGAAVILVAVSAAGCHRAQAKPLPKGTASTTPLITSKSLRSYEHQYPVLKRTISENIVIPGLKGAWTLDKQNHLFVSKGYDVQGVAVSKQYVFISAYDDYKKADSIIFVMNKHTGKYVKSVILQGRPHAGGIAYDPGTKSVWFSDDTHHAQLTRIQLSDIEQYSLAKMKRPVRYSQTVVMPRIKRTSAVAFDQDKLWVGYFDSTRRGVIESYDVFRNPNGTIQVGNKAKNIRDGSDPTQSFDGLDQIQGIAVDGRDVLFSASYGAKPSKLYHYRYDPAKSEFSPIGETKFPAYMEQIAFDRVDSYYAIFESSAPRYRQHKGLKLDRVLVFKLKDIH